MFQLFIQWEPTLVAVHRTWFVCGTTSLAYGGTSGWWRRSCNWGSRGVAGTIAFQFPRRRVKSLSAVVTVASVSRVQNVALRTGYTRRFTAVSAKLGVRKNEVAAL